MLGSVLSRQAKYEEAEVMHRRALEISKVLRPDHRDMLRSMGILSDFQKQPWKA